MNDLEIIFNILNNVIYKDKKSNDQINIFAKKALNLSYVTKVVYGVLENKIYLDYMIDKISDIKLKKIHANILIILEMGFYNIHFLSTKDYATVDKLVDLSKKKNKKSKGFVNAILRNFIRNEEDTAKIKISDDIKSLSVRYSMPYELTRYIYDSYGMEYTKNFLRYTNQYVPLAIRVNRLKTTRDKLRDLLEKDGFNLRNSKISKNALIVENPSGLIDSTYFKEGFFTIQGESSMKTVEVLNPSENTRILDLCAAPGSKSSYLCEISQNTGKILANDISAKKLSLIEENIKRLGLKNISLSNFDASGFKKEFQEAFDYVLVDAPCSGLGLLARKPEIRYKRGMDDIYKLRDLQRKILDQAVKYVKKGGILVFSTCTLGPIENQDNFTYLKNKKDLSHQRIDNKDYLEYVPFEDMTDGFFISKFKKKEYERDN
ncbi:MAG: 16S rRNA (cytosine(967)-C(5))-methyltransferase RsmB [Anaerococcus sp.]|nr:16S rRNA (cytosine(967)-C(5))-methyltransferase RsmB [Anaerococcus sp.]